MASVWNVRNILAAVLPICLPKFQRERVILWLPYFTRFNGKEITHNRPRYDDSGIDRSLDGIFWPKIYQSIMMTSSNGNIFRVTGHRWIPHTKASDVELWCFLNLLLNKRLSKHSWGWWFETPSRPLWRHCNDGTNYHGNQPTWNQ